MVLVSVCIEDDRNQSKLLIEVLDSGLNEASVVYA